MKRHEPEAAEGSDLAAAILAAAAAIDNLADSIADFADMIDDHFPAAHAVEEAHAEAELHKEEGSEEPA